MNTTGYCYSNDGLLNRNVNCSESNACDITENSDDELSNPKCNEGKRCYLPLVDFCSEPTVGTCQLFDGKRRAARLSEVQTRRLGKGLGTKRDWSVEVEEEDTALN